VLGNGKEDRKGNVVYYKENFEGNMVMDVTKKSHMLIMLSAFDTGPMLLNEALHYRVPFVASNNCCAIEFAQHINGKYCETVNIDPPLSSASDCKKYKPMTGSGYINGNIDYKLVMQSIDNIIRNYSQYTSWKWKHEDPYYEQFNKWKNIIESI